MKSKFIDIYTVHGKRTINVNNIASMEDTANGTRIIMNVTSMDGEQIEYLAQKVSQGTTNPFISDQD